MLPLKGEIPARSFPYVTLALVTANLAVFVRAFILAPQQRTEFILNLALVPHELTHLAPFDLHLFLYNTLTIVTSMFLHAGLLHLGGNMLYLWIFGTNVEDVMGHGRFLLFYLLCGLVGAIAQVAVDPASRVPMIGASGAIAGVLGAYLVMYPTARILTLVFLIFFVRVVPIPALIVLGIWLLIQLINAGQIAPGGVAWFAHIGGFVAGLILIVSFRRRKVRHSLY